MFDDVKKEKNKSKKLSFVVMVNNIRNDLLFFIEGAIGFSTATE